MEKPSIQDQFGHGGMSRDDTIILFLRGLRIVLNNACAYPADHPYFMKSVEAFREKVDLLLGLINPIRLHATPTEIFIDGRSWEKDALYVDIANIFHTRKIKSIEIHSGVLTRELQSFLSALGLAHREFLRKGGCKHLMPPSENPHIRVEELDYSMLLGGGTEEVDVWVFLLREAIEKDDRQKLARLAESFSKMVGSFEFNELLEDEELRENIRKFIRYLRDHSRGKLRECGRGLFSVIERYKKILKDDEIERMRMFFRELDEESLARVLWDELSSNERFDGPSMNLFAQLVDSHKHGSVSEHLRAAVADRRSIEKDARLARRLTRLISTTADDSVSAVYQNVIAGLMQGLTFEDSVSFDKEAAARNYRYILLTLFSLERNGGMLEQVLQRLVKDWTTDAGMHECAYMRSLLELISMRKEEHPEFIHCFGEMEKLIGEFIETSVWNDEFDAGLLALVPALKASTLSADTYLGKIFRQQKVNAHALALFFRFFPHDMARLYQAIQETCRSVPFMVKLVAALRSVDTPQSADVLKYIFSCSNEFIRIEVLKGMRDISSFDETFLFGVLQKGDIHLRRASLGVLARRPSSCKKALRMLLEIQTLWGKQVQLLCENISIVGELKIEPARPFLQRLSGRRFFWNAAVRQAAQDTLRRWNAR